MSQSVYLGTGTPIGGAAITVGGTMPTGHCPVRFPNPLLVFTCKTFLIRQRTPIPLKTLCSHLVHFLLWRHRTWQDPHSTLLQVVTWRVFSLGRNQAMATTYYKSQLISTIQKNRQNLKFDFRYHSVWNGIFIVFKVGYWVILSLQKQRRMHND